ncbi:Zinc-finger of C2H2 type [Carex littledalei]|uniref:Zinc-finger of C2H2 type n=1 Tax=Carex littledalei TaxID=544730 RepID=A0A833R3C1_9POAL|nr:Zinc-finger of C2H2 type [Carex littledalei]
MELPTITFEEAHKKEEEYRNKLKMTRCRPVGSNFHQVPIRETTSREQRYPFCTNAEPGARGLPVQSQPQISPNQTSTPALQPTPKPNQQQRNWPPMKPRPPRQHKLPPYVQISRPAQPMSYWCKLCKIDCTTEQNFRAHIGGKKHEAKKLAILEGRSNARGESSGNHNTRNKKENRDQNGSKNIAAECEVVQEGEASGSTSRAAECEVVQEGEASRSTSAQEVESPVESTGPSNGLDGLIDLTNDE